MPIRMEIEHFIKKHSMSPTRFGRLAARDPRLVLDIRNGREPGKLMRDRVRDFMNSYAVKPAG